MASFLLKILRPYTAALTSRTLCTTAAASSSSKSIQSSTNAFQKRSLPLLIPAAAWLGWCLYGDEPLERASLSITLPTRLARDFFTTGSIVSDYYFSLRNVENQDERIKVIKECHKRCAQRLVDLCFANGGIYIKLGQHVGQLDHLLPEPYVVAMRENLLNRCPESSFDHVKKTLESDLEKGVEELFDHIERTPIASASLAQVHVAYDHDGRKLAVKVQHPGLHDTAAVDILTVELLVKAVRWCFPNFDYSWLVDEIKRNLPKELDFVNEAKNAEQCRKNLQSSKSRVRGRVKIPEIYDDLSSRNVLTMEFVEGVSVEDTQGLKDIGVDPKDVAELIATTFSEMIFVFGEVHCDPHAANLLIRSKKGQAELVLLDHGLYEVMDKSFRHDYAGLWHALVFADHAQIKKYSQKMNAGELYALFAAILTTKPWDEITEKSVDHLRITGSTGEKQRIQSYAKQYAPEITELLLRIPRALLLLLKTNDCLRAIDGSLGQPINTFKVTARECTRALAEKRSSTLPPLVSHATYFFDIVNVEFRLLLLNVMTTLACIRGWWRGPL